jgi:acyl-CoA thioesterase-1
LLKKVLLLGVLTSLAACSRPAPTPVVIGVIGDSTTWGFSSISTAADGRVAVPEPQALQANLHGTAIVKNYGINMSTADVLLKGGIVTFDDVVANNRDIGIVVINYGINDALMVDIEAYKKSMRSLITKSETAGKVVVLEEPNPSCLASRAKLPQFVAAMDALAVEYKLALIPNYRVILAQPDWEKSLPDCLHPTQALYLLKAAEAAKVIAPIVERLQSGAAN